MEQIWDVSLIVEDIQGLAMESMPMPIVLELIMPDGSKPQILKEQIMESTLKLTVGLVGLRTMLFMRMLMDLGIAMRYILMGGIFLPMEPPVLVDRF
jgi:hypothetical protein